MRLILEKRGVLFISGVLSILVAFVFYRSLWAMLLWPIWYWMIKRKDMQIRREKRIGQLREQFMSGLQVLNTSLQAGLSMENAWKEVEKETKLLYGETAELYQELRQMNQAVAFNMPIEKLFLELAYRIEVEDIVNFAEIMDYGKRSGGDWKKMIEGTVLRMCERYEMQKEIEVMLAAKHLEQQVVNVVPIGLLLFLQVSSWDYVAVLYHNPFGIVCMTICLVCYGISVYAAEKIMKIQV